MSTAGLSPQSSASGVIVERVQVFDAENRQPMAKREAAGPTARGIPLVLMLFVLFCLTAFSFQGGFGATDTSSLTLADRASAGRGYVAGLIYLLALVGVMNSPATMVKLGFRMWPHSLFILFAVASAAWSANPLWVVVFACNCCGVWLLAIATARRWSLSRDRLYVTIHWTLVAYLLASILVVYLLPKMGLRQIADTTGTEVHRWQGFASHPNTLGSSTVLLVWAALTLRMTTRHRLMFLVTNVTIPLAVAIALFGARSMTAAMADIGMIATHFLLPKVTSPARSSKKRLLLLIALALGGTLLAAFLAFLFLDSTGAHGAVRFAGRDLTLSGRVALWDVGWRAFAARPLAGWSFDYLASFLQAANGYITTGHFHNGWINILVLGGLSGLFLTSAMMVRFVKVMVKISKTDPIGARSSGVFFIAFMLENLGETQLCEVSHALWGVFLVLWAMNEYQILYGFPGVPHAARATSARPFPSRTR